VDFLGGDGSAQAISFPGLNFRKLNEQFRALATFDNFKNPARKK